MSGCQFYSRRQLGIPWDSASCEPQEEIRCQAPKPILLNTGDIDKPYEWDPETVATNSTSRECFHLVSARRTHHMAGRRLRNQVEESQRKWNHPRESENTRYHRWIV